MWEILLLFFKPRDLYNFHCCACFKGSRLSSSHVFLSKLPAVVFRITSTDRRRSWLQCDSVEVRQTGSGNTSATLPPHCWGFSTIPTGAGRLCTPARTDADGGGAGRGGSSWRVTSRWYGMSVNDAIQQFATAVVLSRSSTYTSVRCLYRGGSRGWLGWLVTPWHGSLFHVIIMRVT